MGKRVNFADLAADNFYDTSTPPDAAMIPIQSTQQDSRRVVAISEVSTNPLNKRPAGSDEDLAGMAETIKQHGVIQPLVVCTADTYGARFPDQVPAIGKARWVVLIGNRRLLAARTAGLEEVAIIVNDEQVASMYEVMLIENGQRRDLPPLMEAEAISEALRAGSISQRELSRRIGKSPMYISQRLALLKLIPPLRSALERGELKIEQAREFGELPEHEQEQIAAGGRPYRRVRGNTANGHGRLRSIRVSSPAVAAESLRSKFSPSEMTELVKLLTAHLDSLESGNEE